MYFISRQPLSNLSSYNTEGTVIIHVCYLDKVYVIGRNYKPRYEAVGIGWAYFLAKVLLFATIRQVPSHALSSCTKGWVHFTL